MVITWALHSFRSFAQPPLSLDGASTFNMLSKIQKKINVRNNTKTCKSNHNPEHRFDSVFVWMGKNKKKHFWPVDQDVAHVRHLSMLLILQAAYPSRMLSENSWCGSVNDTGVLKSRGCRASRRRSTSSRNSGVSTTAAVVARQLSI